MLAERINISDPDWQHVRASRTKRNQYKVIDSNYSIGIYYLELIAKIKNLQCLLALSGSKEMN